MTAATIPAASSAYAGPRPQLSVAQILQMNLGFLGLQFSFGLQQANMSPIWGYLGAEEKNFAWLGIAGPLTGLIVQPIIGSLSDRTASRWGRRTPYFLAGAVMCALGLFLMPLSASVLMAFSLLFLLDVGNNVTMEPYRAYVNDRLEADQRGFGFLSQSAFTGLAQCLAYLSPTLLVTWFGLSKDATAGGGIPTFTLVSFWIGAVLSLGTILWSITRVPELKLPDAERARLAALPKNPAATLGEIVSAMREMPKAMKAMAWMSLFQWYAMSGYWGYVTNSISRSVYGTADASTAAYRDAVLTNGQIGAFFNLIAFVSALAMAPMARRVGAGRLHAFCLTLSGFAMLAMPLIGVKELLFVAAIGIGLGWGSIMGNPYIILADTIPPERTGVYMGIFNMFICVPMLVFAGTMTFAYEPLLGGDARNVLRVSGVCMLLAAIAVWRIKEGRGSAVAAAG
ncbi:MFS transporter [Novosphingobium ginsenosidimutans]|nr:MFS transporter [Novosphingobium ginsenosidimutans]